MIVVGIDIGLTGAVSAIGPGVCAVHDIPTVQDGKTRRIDGRALILLLRQMIPPGETAKAVIEDVRPRPGGNGNAHGNSMHSQGSLMRSRGIVEAVLDIARIEANAVQPQAWKRRFGLIGKGKADAREIACRLYPGASEHLKRVKDHNRAESLLIAKFGEDTLA